MRLSAVAPGNAVIFKYMSGNREWPQQRIVKFIDTLKAAIAALFNTCLGGTYERDLG